MDSTELLSLITNAMAFARKDAIEQPITDHMRGYYCGLITGYSIVAGTLEASELADQCKAEIRQMNKGVPA